MNGANQVVEGKAEIQEKKEGSDSDVEVKEVEGESPFWTLDYVKRDHTWKADNDSEEEEEPENPIHELLKAENSSLNFDGDKRECSIEETPLSQV